MEEPMKRPMTIAFAALVALGVVAAAITLDNRGEQQSAEASIQQQPSTPISTTEGVEPYVVRTESGDLVGPGGNVACDQLGVFDYTSARTDYQEGGPGNFTVDLTDANNMVVGSVQVMYSESTKTLDFTADIAIDAVIVKGGDDANIYDYQPDGTFADTGLGAPPNASGGSAGLSNVTLCANPRDNPPSSNWCSPGYWRNHPAAWDATGISPDELYTAYFAANTLSKKASNMNPTLDEVLKAPQTYGGNAFNNVGDLLSEAHPEVDWSPGDDRTENSCPLS